MAGLRCTIVLDTSALLSSLPFVKSLCASAPAHSTELLVPHETINELDRIKDDRGGRGGELVFQARAAINWIKDVLTQQDPDEVPALRGQKKGECTDPHLKHDSAILDCAVYNFRNTGRMTIMFSEDHNLCNRALIEGLDTLESRIPGLTADVVFEAIDKRFANDMDLDDWRQPHWSPPPEPARQLSPVLPAPQEVLSRRGDPPAGGPAGVPKAAQSPAGEPMPPPAEGADLQERVTKSIAGLLDWYLRQDYSAEELTYLKYERPPATSREVARVLKQFRSTFSDKVPRNVAETFLMEVKDGCVDKQYVLAHLKLLQALSGHNAEYESMVTSMLQVPDTMDCDD